MRHTPEGSEGMSEQVNLSGWRKLHQQAVQIRRVREMAKTTRALEEVIAAIDELEQVIREWPDEYFARER